MAQRPYVQFNMQNLFLLVLIVAIALGWWRTSNELAQSRAQIDAIRRSYEIAASDPKASGISIPRELPFNQIETPEQFITALRTIEDWYEFADDTADPIAKTSVADETIPLLLDLLDDADAEIRTRALATLWKIKRHPDIVVPAVIPLLNDDVANVRWHAAFTLGQFGDDARTGIPALTSQMNDDESPIAAFSAMILQHIDETIPTKDA